MSQLLKDIKHIFNMLRQEKLRLEALLNENKEDHFPIYKIETKHTSFKDTDEKAS